MKTIKRTVNILKGIVPAAFMLMALPAAADYPERPVSVIIAYGAGGNTDVGARILFPKVEQALGATLNIINRPGGGGWVGWTQMLNAKSDGYTLGYINTPNLTTGYLDPHYKRKATLDDFDLIANHVTDYGVISINKDETRFTNIQELVEYAKSNTLTASTTGANGDDHIAMLKMNQKFATQFVPVHTTGTAEQRAALQGGHVDVSFSNVGDTNLAHKGGDLAIIAVMAPERSSFIPDVPTLSESGFPDVVSWSARGIAAPKGLSEEQLASLREAFIAGLNDPEHLAKMKEMGLQVDIRTGDDYRAMLLEEENGIRELSELLGW
ncbi:MAG: tripartite tricarboxylate transporter substrate binding protein [Comamonas sp.]|jgi:tripartite-type tricarboxylate transporter receptor subunit TctC|uniref:Tripartite-type tricarboxylate transporter, receptor component TctC n=1 Tax=Ectopseudomonas composti TaxID=658457 RepID=A0A1I5QU82_9GAMM|nr:MULTISPECIES: tripartite tricarboxylate transporter substrate binding protein [Pseudomonas]MDN5506589.1 tripartite tricarboxylate transporter substrate binding protein [Comamonas sp.]QNH05079.1 tripartite tricarboxylate transporter substrate binding protein [Pseudomonas sp. B11D7D]SFP49783.1 Tripartite-type tricarboxylate transporter, receptor component TctC [Pseudomonas composti]